MEGWTCLDLSCPQFWLLATPIGLLPIPPGFKLSYSSHWLECAPTPPGLESVPYSVIPAPPGVSLSEVAENAGGRELWKGEPEVCLAKTEEQGGFVVIVVERIVGIDGRCG